MDGIESVLAGLVEQRKQHSDAMIEIAKAAVAGNRSFTEDEERRYSEARDELEKLDSRIEDLQKEQRSAELAAAASAPYESRARVTNEPATYSAHTERRGISFFRDIVSAQQGDPEAMGRLQRHGKESRDQYAEFFESRDVGTGAFAGLTVPVYLTDMVAPLRRAGRPFANICNRHPLPPSGTTVNISRITTGTAVASQNGENTAVQETDADDTLLTVPLVTVAGMQDVSRQVVDRSTGGDEIVIQDLARAYHTELDRQLINGSGAAGQHLGVLNTSGAINVAYTDATPTVAEAYPNLFNLISQIQAGVFLGISYLLMASRRWWWFANAVGTSFPFLTILPGSPVRAGETGTREYEQGPSGIIAGVPVIVDGNIPLNLGGGTNEDRILGVTDGECHLWEDTGAPLLIRTDQALANQLSVRFVLYGYSAFTAGRYPGANGFIQGTGLVTPTFTGA